MLFPNVRIRLQPVPDDLIQFLARGGVANSFRDLTRERMNEHAAGCFGPDASRTQVENRLLIKLPDRRAVRAFHIIRIDLKLRLGIHCGVVREEKVLVGLLGVGFLRDGMDIDASMEDPFGFAVENTVEILMAIAVRLGVLDDHVMVRELITPSHIQTVEQAFHTFARQHHADVVSGDPAPQGDRMGSEVRALPEMRVNRGQMERAEAFILELAMLDDGAIPQNQFGDCVGEVGRILERDVTQGWWLGCSLPPESGSADGRLRQLLSPW